MKRRGELRWGTIIRALSTVALLACLGCGGAIDGGGRGTGIGAATIAGNIASSGPSTSVDPMCPFAGQNAFVSVRGTNVQAPVEADCTFELRQVPSGDVTLDIESDEGSNTLTINSVPPESVVVLTDVRLREDSTDVAAIEVRPATPAPPRAFAIIVDPPAGDAPLAVQFSFAPDPLPATAVTWTFGDRSTGSTDPTPAHVYDVPGDYVAALTVAEPGRQPQLVYTVVRATAPPAEEPLSVRLRAAPTSGAPPLTVEFEASVFGGRPAAKFVWSFGDGSPQLVTHQAAVSHEYLRTGSFVTILTVTDDLGRETGTSFPVVIERSAVTVRPTSTATSRNGLPEASPTPSRGANAAVTPTATIGFNAVATPTGGGKLEITPTRGLDAIPTPTPATNTGRTATPATNTGRTATPSGNARQTPTVAIGAARTPTEGKPVPTPTTARTAVLTPVAPAADTPRPTATSGRSPVATPSATVNAVDRTTPARTGPSGTPVPSATRAPTLRPPPPPTAAPTRAPTLASGTRGAST